MTLAAAALVVLSGCGALGGGTAAPGERTATDAPGTGDGGGTGSASAASTPDPTATPFSTLTPAARATPEEGESLPPGVREDGSVNETALLIAHFEATNRSGWRLAHRNGNDTQVIYSADGEQYRRDDRGVDWYTEGVLVTNRTLLGAPYEMESASNTTAMPSRPTGGIVLALGVRMATSNYRAVGTTESGGRTLYELRMTGTKEAAGTGHYTGRMLVDDAGRIHRLTGEVGDNESVADTYDFDYEWGVDAVPRPPWLDRIPRGVVEKTPDGTALNVTLTGEAPIPAGTELTVRHNRTGRPVTLDGALEPGESLYVGLRGGGDERSVAVGREPPTGGDLIDLRGGQTRLAGTVTVDGDEVDLSFAAGWSGI